MAGDGVLYVWDDAEFQKMLAATIRRTGNMKKPMKDFAEYMETRTMDRFKKEQSPKGSPWKPLKPATLAAKQNDKGAIQKILHYGGYLRDSVRPEWGTDYGGVLADSEYAAIHNRGGYAGRGRATKIPQREFLNFNDDDIAEFKQAVTDWVVLGRRTT